MISRAERLNEVVQWVKTGGTRSFDTTLYEVGGPLVVAFTLEVSPVYRDAPPFVQMKYQKGYWLLFGAEGTNVEAVFRAMINLAEEHEIPESIISELFGEG